MDLGRISFESKAILNIAAMKGGEVSLAKGEVISGTVQEVQDNGLIVINIKGKNIEALSEVAVKEGQKLYLTVDDVRGGKTYLRVMTPEAMEKMEASNLVANLRNINIVANDASVQMARKLIQYQLPVTEKNLNEMSRMINQLGGRSAQNLEIAAYALSRGLSSDGASLRALQQFIAQKTDSLMQFVNLVGALSEDSGAEALNALRNAAQILSGEEGAPSSASAPGTTAGTTTSSSPGTTGSNAPGTVPGTVASNVPEGQPAPVPAADTGLPSRPAPHSASASPATTAGPVTTAAAGENSAGASSLTGSAVPTGADGDVPAPPGARMTTVLPGAAASEEILPGSGTAAPADSSRQAASASPGQPVAGTPLPEGPAGTGTGIPGSPASAEAARAAPLIPDSAEEGAPPAAARPETAATPAAAATDNSSTVATLGSRPEAAAPGSADRLLLDLFRALSEKATVRMDSDSAIIASDLRDRITGEKDLLRGMAVLKQLAGDDAAIDKQPVAREILRTIEGLERDLSGQRLFNFSSRTGPDVNPSVYYFSIPVKYDDQYRMMQLKMTGDGGRKGLVDPEHLTVAVSLDTQNLGIVIYHVEWFKKGDLNIQGLVQDQDTADFMSADMDRLVGNLAGMGYNVNNLGVRVSKTSQEAEELKPQLVEATDNVKPFGIDVTV